ncbi:MAG: Panacea domain-containing protein [Clostridia bacterium]
MKGIDVANFFIDLAINIDDDSVTNLKIQKLLYFSQGYALAKLGKPLFSDNIEAWEMGPVVPAVYSALKQNGRNPIPHTVGEFSEEVFSNDELDLLLGINEKYGQYTASKLVDMSHDTDPWKDNYCPENRHANISNESIKDYFSRLPDLPQFQLPDLETIGYIDEEGFTVLPKEWNDE